MSFKCGIVLLMLVCGIEYCAGGCSDRSPHCEDWAANGECHKNPYAVLTTCPISCGVDCQPCRDHVWYCSDLTEDCHSNPYATIHGCPKTCGACTEH